MKRRTVIGLAAGVAVSLAAGAGAVAYGTHAGMRHGIMKRMIAAGLDEALDQAQVTPQQRATIHAARDRVFASLEGVHADRRQHLEEVLGLFEAEQVDAARVEALHREAEAARERMRAVIHEAIVEVHGVLTPAQRKTLADHVRAHRFSHH
ncbi:MAG TPA: periplasmic heavy metal sensor [Vicinamibacteria bacterium]|nr:periplasmic heavy metal sensor [Vicinamibacteria bacterium]